MIEEPLRTTSAWRPILSGRARDQALEAVRAVCADIEAMHDADALEPNPRVHPLTLLSDHALLLAHAGRALGQPRYDALADLLLDRAVDLLAQTAPAPWLHGGYTGLAMTVGDLEALVTTEEPRGDGDGHDPAEEDDANSEIDAEVRGMLARAPWQGDYDLISGLCGIGTYLASRLPRPDAQDGLALVVRWLVEASEPAPVGRTWHTPVELLPEWQREEATDGYYNLGVAHGVPGVIVLLARAVAAGVALPESRPLLEDAVAWLLAQRQAPEVGSAFCAWQHQGLGPMPSRLAWCYGDPGVGTALLAAARLVGRADWQAASVDVLLGCTRRPVDASGVQDAGLCHGSAGLGHLFNRAWQGTGEPAFAESARFWLEHALAQREPGAWVGGFWAYSPYRMDDGERVVSQEPIQSDATFLTGSAGIALALLAAATPYEPAWDRRLLTDVPLEGRTHGAAFAA